MHFFSQQGFYEISVLAGGLSLDCVTPPMECPNINITFWLYTRSTQDTPHELKALDTETITSASWVKDAPVKILIHGYTGHKDFSPNTEIRPAYMECCDYNIISVDYNPIAREPCYFQAAANVQLVGKCTAQLIDTLVEKHNFPLSIFHVVGFSLGGQAAGAISNYLKSGMLDRVTGLDPAMPLFVTNDKKKKLDAGDAKAVDVLHTNGLEKGKLEQSGTCDFYANGGLGQPGCLDSEMGKSGCDHERACLYFAESITSKLGFYSTRCLSWISYMIGWCEFYNAEEEVLFGEYMPLKQVSTDLFLISENGCSCTRLEQSFQGSTSLVRVRPPPESHFRQTNSESPYARGSTKKKGKREGYDARALDGPGGDIVDYPNEHDARDKGKYQKLSIDNDLVHVLQKCHWKCGGIKSLASVTSGPGRRIEVLAGLLEFLYAQRPEVKTALRGHFRQSSAAARMRRTRHVY
ncbi:Pancreatic lipase-related protein 3 [Eumeta japonica]|uniref:Pancreatic lipase-related protein 3 n=1 Tax=Eumeta variegata TaxID=151549 RepID=A0A4C1WHR9_EUMVA|nr:Pancreatic lipase-related protein 3 [Eumeta japonica]